MSDAMTDTSTDNVSKLADLLTSCTSQGADGADARLSLSEGASLDIREGKLEGVERAEQMSVSLRCFVGQRQAHVSGADLSTEGLAALAERCVAMAKAVPEDPYCGLTPEGELAGEDRDLDLAGDGEIDVETMEADALAAEAAAMAVNGVKQVSDCSVGWSRSETWLAATNGFTRYMAGSGSSIGVVCIAEQDGKMERSYEARRSRYVADRPSPTDIGRRAGEKTIARLAPRKLETQTAAVIYDREVSASLMGAFLSAITGPSIARGISFLKDKRGEAVFGPDISIVDDPFRVRGFGSRLFDGEGRPVARRAIIDNGVLSDWLLNGPSARQLGLTPNGYASFGFGDPPGVSPSNVHMEPGEHTPAELMKQVGRGLLVNDMFGPSINPNTGDYSVGVSGQWFEDGELAYPVSEVTIAGDLPSMFARLIPANDLELRGTRDAPSILIEDMSIAGS